MAASNAHDSRSSRLPCAGVCVAADAAQSASIKEAPYKSAASNSMDKKRMAEAGVLNGHAHHSSKKGALQAEAAAGKQMPELLKDACMKTSSVMRRCLDPDHHVRSCPENMSEGVHCNRDEG